MGFEGGKTPSKLLPCCPVKLPVWFRVTECGSETYRVLEDLKLNRRAFIRQTGLSSAAFISTLTGIRRSRPQSATNAPRLVETPTLTIGFEENGEPAGFPIVLLHGFPDDVRAWNDVTPLLATNGFTARMQRPPSSGKAASSIRKPQACFKLEPEAMPPGGPELQGDYCGFSPVACKIGGHFRNSAAPRMAEQAALGQDLNDFADALGISRFAVAGYDWGGRAACIASALHPDRVRAAVFIGGYLIQNTITPSPPAAPETERALWYQWYFNTERGRAGLSQNRRGICRLLWETWSPSWRFTDETFNRTAASFDNPDFVDVVIHSYRHRNGNAQGEARFEAIEQQLAKRPKIHVPSIVLYGGNDGVSLKPPAESIDRELFTSLAGREVIPNAGHFLPRENPDVVSSALLKLLENTK